MDQNEFYELQVGRGNDVRENNGWALLERDRFVVEYIALFNSAIYRSIRVAELSIGEGRLTRSLLRRFPGLKLDGLDISRSRIDYVRHIIDKDSDLDNSGVQFSECNFDTQFAIAKSSSYQVVIALDVLEHVIDVFGFIENCRRILTNDGLLFIRVPNIAYLRHRVALLFGHIPVTSSWFGPPQDLEAWHKQHGWDGGHLHLFTVPLLYRLLDRFGFRVEVCRDPGTRLESLRNLAPKLLYSNPLIVARAR
jgi:SAM-dependent methyltransferase